MFDHWSREDLFSLPVTKPGLYRMTEAEYHADPCSKPSLNCGTIKVLDRETPFHALWQHPRLNPDFQHEQKRCYDLGSAAHAMVLNNGAIQEIKTDSFRTKAAKEARDAAYDAGQIPVLTHELAEVRKMLTAFKSQFQGWFVPGETEVVAIWQEGKTWCRARIDFLPYDLSTIGDYKTFAGLAGPRHWGRTQLFSERLDIQAAWYGRGISAIFGIEPPPFQFVVQERKAPYCLAIHELAPAALAQADRDIERALHQFTTCLNSGRWPAWAKQPYTHDVPAWLAVGALEREVIEPTPKSALAAGLVFHAPLENDK